MRVIICGSGDFFDMSLKKAIEGAMEYHTIECVSPIKEKMEQLDNEYVEIILPRVIQIQKEDKNKDRFGKFIKRKFR